jgi:hypothetical protein
MHFAVLRLQPHPALLASAVAWIIVGDEGFRVSGVILKLHKPLMRGYVVHKWVSGDAGCVGSAHVIGASAWGSSATVAQHRPNGEFLA